MQPKGIELDKTLQNDHNMYYIELAYPAHDKEAF
jgi:hypothetical protein